MSVEVKDTRARPAPKYRRPDLLDRIPPSPVTTPGFYAAAAGVVLIYGLGFSIWYSGHRANEKAEAIALAKERLDRLNRRPEPIAVNPHVAPTSPRNDAVKPPDQPPPPSIADAKPSDPAPPPGSTEGQVQLAKVDTDPEKIKPEKIKPKKVEPVKVVLDHKVLSNLIVDPTVKAKLSRDDQGLTITMPGNKLCILEIGTAPRAMTEVEGDFDLQVRVVGDQKGEMRPGSDPVKNAPLGPGMMPVAFNGAGLLLCRDEGPVIRLERTVSTQNGRNFFPTVLFELWKGGQMVESAYPEVPAGAMYLRVARHGGDFACSYSLDGKDWKGVKKVNPGFPSKINVGVSATNTSKKGFPVRFEDFSITQMKKP